MKETKVWLIRHGEVAANGIFYGSLDVDLTPAGLQQARQIAAALADQPFAAIYTSPLQRCAVAARMLAEGRQCALTPVDALRELDFGDFEGRPYEDILKQYPDFQGGWMELAIHAGFPGGEGLEAMRARVLAAAAGLRARHEGEHVAVVTHGGVIRIWLAEALGMPPQHLFRIGQNHAAVNIVRYWGDEALVSLVNGSLQKDPGLH
jgi:alpha-ribazole phosphatase